MWPRTFKVRAIAYDLKRLRNGEIWSLVNVLDEASTPNLTTFPVESHLA
jgi:hypothetical protein